MCEDVGLRSNTNYKYRVRETCNRTDMPSPAGESVARLSTLPVAAMPPTGVRGGTATPSSLEVLWSGPDSMGDCEFLRWRVEIREVGGELSTEFEGASGGCGAWMLTSECRVSCVAEGLQSKTDYELRVKVECTNIETSSEFSSISPVASTLPAPASAPTSVETSNVFEKSVELVWSAGEPNECTFREWEVMYQEGGSTAWTAAAGCGVAERASPACNATGLSCDTGYVFRVRETCTDSEADSAWAMGIGVRTPKGETCFTRATAPTGIQMKNATASSMVVEWHGGESNDCAFVSWQVERQDGATNFRNPSDFDTIGGGRNSVSIFCGAKTVF